MLIDAVMDSKRLGSEEHHDTVKLIKREHSGISLDGNACVFVVQELLRIVGGFSTSYGYE